MFLESSDYWNKGFEIDYRAILNVIKHQYFSGFREASTLLGSLLLFNVDGSHGPLLRDSAVVGHSRAASLHLLRHQTDTISAVFPHHRHYLVVIPAALRYPSTQVACLHITCHDAKIQVNLALERSAGQELLMQETIHKKKTFLCTKFWVSHPWQMPSLIFLLGKCLCCSLTRGDVGRVCFVLV